MKYKILLLLLTGFILIQGCDSGLDGNLNENIPPKTSLTVNEINLPEGERLISQVNISWWGDDPDGYIVGYEIFIGEGHEDADAQWDYTTRTDSVFVLPIPEGELDANVRFTVRAVDNQGARDPNPPSLVFPIRNSPPSISFINNELPPDSTYKVASFGFRATDPDGDSNLNRIEIALNDTLSEESWKTIPTGIDLITLLIDDTEAIGTASVFLGRALNTSDIEFTNVNVDGDNELFIRTIDNAAAVSNIVGHEWFVKKQTSKILFLNDYQGSFSSDRATLHLGLLNSLGITEIDYIDISDGDATGGRRVPLTSAFHNRALGSPTINLMFAQWDHIYWISNDLNRNIGYALELTIDFFANGGNMFINIPVGFVADDNPLLDFLPFERVQPVPSGQSAFVIPRDSLAIPDPSLINPPFLKFRTEVRGVVNPVIPFAESRALFDAPFRLRNVVGTVIDYDGPKQISALSPDERVLFFGVDLDSFTRPEATEPSDLQGLLQLFLIETLGFQQ
jgi:hypothetical protein